MVQFISQIWTQHFNSPTPRNHLAAVAPHNSNDWPRPPDGWFCLNSDGVVPSSDRIGTAGGVLRDSNGSWLIGFSKKLGISSILQDELAWNKAAWCSHAWETRTRNPVADGLAKLPPSNLSEVIYYETPPTSIVHLLDLNASSHPLV
ncbi:hypothetical protein F3Y22_tig00116964pilonHSYRG00259 [Hibiscus syriacus]|uniref:RNase H type-1 domain-containing protein n=1 Tax=Hibiscus syriacus TaxID=106335 RepID=A0A6A2XAN9_HIBSY|nr:hypothetical protein F3Y22_tig00116964pilonHSYRG00259 [Hibiscus syriacus]